MAEFKLRLPAFWDFQRRHASTVHVIGLDGVPWPCRVSLEDGNLLIRRNRNDSGRIYVSFPFPGRGEISVCTGTLPEREQPYDLVTELARGTLNRLRNQTSIWQEGGLEIPDEVQQLTAEAIRLLGRSILSTGDGAIGDGMVNEKQAAAKGSIEKTMDAVFALCDHFGKTISDFRVSQDDLPPFWLATAVSGSEQVQNDATKCFDLLEIERESKIGLSAAQRLIVGPMLDASPDSSPGVDAEINSDFETRKRAIRESCNQWLSEITGRTSLIHAVCGLNGIGHRQMSFTQQMQLTTEILAAIDDFSRDIPVLVSFDNPWAERLAWSVGGTHPLQIADSLIRQGRPISFLGLDINLDYWPGGSVIRDPLQWIDLIDVWSQLGLPLILCMRIPQGVQNDCGDPGAESSPENRVDSGEPKAKVPAKNTVRCHLTDSERIRFLDTLLPMIIARPSVHGIIWRQWQDDDDSRFPGGGLADNHGQQKAVFEQINCVHSNILKRR